MTGADRVLVDGLALRAYIVEVDSDADFREGCIVYSYSEAAALEYGALVNAWEVDWCDATHAPQHDERAARHIATSVEHDSEYLRSVGWRLEGEHSCESCGYHANGVEKFAVCRECALCKECGCEEGCKQSQGWSCG